MKSEYPLYFANRPQTPNLDLEVTDKYTGQVVARVPKANRDLIDRAIGKALEAAEPMRNMPHFARQAVLNHCVARFSERADELGEALCIEAGKPIVHARGEVSRLIDTFRIAAEESVRQTGEILPLDISPRAKGYWGQWQRFAIGPCAFITPWNFPLNLPAHKVAPALAVGCPFVMKPASYTPIGALIIGEVLAQTELPEGAFSILPCSRDAADLLTEDERLKMLSFTGSAEVGWDLKRRAGRKRVSLELGGNAACIIDADTTDFEDAVNRLIFGAYYQSGQSCISVQRILAHESIYDQLRDRLVEEIKKLPVGDPKDEKTFIGPVITEEDAKRIESWIQSAVGKGAKLLCGGQRDGVMLTPALVEDVPHDEILYYQEVFGPVACIEKFTDFDAALDEANNTKYGLQAGVFTRDIHKIHRAWEKLDVGGVIINDVPSWRVDHMPYGGVKDSGQGREGIRFAMEEMTEIKLLVVRESRAQ